MKRKVILAAVAVVILLSLMGCSAHVHTVGRGPQTAQQMQARQWYVLFGLIPLNDVNTSQMVGETTDYEIKTEQSALDIIINIFTGSISVYSRTVTVTK